MNGQQLAGFRNIAFSALGLILAAYAIGVLVTGRPDPVSPLVPSLAGIIVAFLVSTTAWLSRKGAAGIAWDELVRSTWKSALRRGYWVAVWLYAVFGLALYNDLVTFPQAFAAMGTLTGAAPFLFFLVAWIRGRV